MGNGLRRLLPAQCLSCGAAVEGEGGLCPDCWRDTPFATGLVCDACGTPLPGEAEAGRAELCDECLQMPRPWARGRAALVYRGAGRRLPMALKHGDRLDLATPLAVWMLRAARPILEPDMLVAPVPLHWLRLLRRRYNQSAILSARLARAAGLDHCPDLLLRIRATPSQEGRDRAERFANLDGALRPHPHRTALIRDRHILLVDDVMTSGATFAAATEACRAAGAKAVSTLCLARVAKDG